MSVYSAMAGDCPPVTSSGAALSCSPVSNGYTVTIGTGSAITVVPTLENCIPEVVDAVELGGAVVAALAAAFGLKLLWRAF
ncbi:MAG: hypothetical protein PHD43_22365 [Methylococcales bacterium]|nr:hypothetical protein [Methylococcales bacterium]